jgi:hypothetical protein
MVSANTKEPPSLVPKANRHRRRGYLIVAVVCACLTIQSYYVPFDGSVFPDSNQTPRLRIRSRSGFFFLQHTRRVAPYPFSDAPGRALVPWIHIVWWRQDPNQTLARYGYVPPEVLTAATRPDLPHYYRWGLDIPYWLIGVPCAFVWLRSSLKTYRAHRHQQRSGLCPTCGYDLRASKDRCPECGTPIPAPPPATPPPSRT